MIGKGKSIFPGICQELYIIRNCLSHLHFLLMGTFIITYSLLQIIPTGKGCYKKFKYGRNMTNTGTAGNTLWPKCHTPGYCRFYLDPLRHFTDMTKEQAPEDTF